VADLLGVGGGGVGDLLGVGGGGVGDLLGVGGIGVADLLGVGVVHEGQTPLPPLLLRVEETVPPQDTPLELKSCS